MNVRYLGFEERFGEDRARFAFFGRSGESGSGSQDDLDMGTGSDHEPKRLDENEARILEAIGTDKLYLPTQVHGTSIITLDTTPAPGVTRGESADGVVTTVSGVAVGVLTADCVPLLLADRHGRLAAAVHAGWRGLAAGIVGRALEAIAGMGVGPDDLICVVGPAIGPCCYEVDRELAGRFEREVACASEFVDSRPVRPTIDLPGLAAAQIRSAGVPSDSIHVIRRCTSCERRAFFSHRRDHGKTGRQLSAMVVHKL